MKFFTLVFSICFLFKAQAQQYIPCYTDEIRKMNEKKYPWYKKAVEDAFNEAKNASKEQINKTDDFTGDSIYTINVVFHVLWNVPKENIHDSVLIRQMEILNRDFGRTNADSIKTKPMFRSRAIAAGINFVLANRDPKGDSTNGIIRKQTSVKGFVANLTGGFYSDSIKISSKGGDDAWNTAKYLNIWVGRIKNHVTNGGGQEEDIDDQIFGFAFPPAKMPNWGANSGPESPEVDGMVLLYKVVGDNNPSFINSFIKGGRTAVHEAGHYLGLRHIWGDGLDDCTDSDGVDDTPNAKNKQDINKCDSVNTCTESPGPEVPDMSENYMDYTSDKCTNMFSRGQVNLMRGVMKTKRKFLYSYGLSVKNNSNLPKIETMPNPATNELTIKLNLNESNKSEIRIYNQIGMLVYFGEVVGRKIEEKINIESLPNSIYSIRISGENNQVYTSKFIKLN